MSLTPIKGTFLYDRSESDHGLEALLDFEMSWVLRVCANQEEKERRPKLFYQCNVILQKLLDLPPSNYTVRSVKVWKQWWRIDIWSEIIIDFEGKEQRYVLVLENKAYTMMRGHQRDDYPKIVMDYYIAKPEFKNYELRLGVITFFEPDVDEEYFNTLDQFCKNGEHKWTLFSTSDLPDWDVDDVTESDLFNEFWFARCNLEQ